MALNRDWATESTDISGATVTDTPTNGTNVVLDVYEGAHCYVDANFPVTPTDNLIIEVVPSIDDGTTYDTGSSYSFTLDNGTDPNRKGFIVTGWRSFRVSVYASGATDEITVTVKSRRWNWVSA